MDNEFQPWYLVACDYSPMPNFNAILATPSLNLGSDGQ